jgi:two-component system, sensor histidine kinase and response regulator
MNHGNNIFEPGRNPVILIVDDNPQNLQVLGSLLRGKNYEIEFATNGSAALEWIGLQQFDLVLLDINMPEMDGFEVCQKIRSNQKLNSMPVIFLSADSDRESILKGFEMGAADYVTKPFDSRELIARVKTQLILRESLGKLERVNKYLEEKVAERTKELKNVNEKLELMNQKLTELDDAKSEFLSLISHEIRTPLNGICGPVELLKDPLKSTELNELLEILDSSVKRLENFSTNAILITTLKTRSYVLSNKSVHIRNVISESLASFSEIINKKQLRLKTEMCYSPELIPGDADLIKKCLSNIIDNAVTYSPPESTIEIKTIPDAEYYCITISDTGKGIPAKIINNSFEFFSRANNNKDNSTGIGLPLAKLIMNAHNGLIELKNRPEGGASVILKFRLVPENRHGI